MEMRSKSGRTGDRLGEEVIWAIGHDVAVERNQNLHARADISSNAVTQRPGLRTIRDEPPPRHRNIVGWPPDEQKEERKLLAVELAVSATLHLPA